MHSYNYSKVTKYKLCVLFMALNCSWNWAQEKEDDNIGTEVINVVKPYTPTVSDAFKVKEQPVIDDEEDLKKQEVKYEINSVPVASTFTPAKGKAAGVEKVPPKKLYNNYASLGVGNYLNVLGEFYASLPISRTESFTVGLNHHSTQGELPDVQLDDKFYDTDLNLSFGKRDKDVAYQIEGLFKHQFYNWYGTSYDFTDAQRAAIDASHTYMTGGLNASLEVKNSFFKGGSLGYKRFWDNYDASENHLHLLPEFQIDVADHEVSLVGILDYVGGVFDHRGADLKYANLKAGIQPSFQLLEDDLSVTLGVALIAGIDSENSDTDFYIYPKITASYNLLDDQVIAFAGLEGDLQQNSYFKFAQINPYLSPLQQIKPTHNQLNGYLGIKGKISSKVNYKLRAGYNHESDKGLLRLNPINDVALVTENYQKANSFGVVYDKVSTISVSGKIGAEIGKNYVVGVNGTYASYNTDKQAEAWNLPELEFGIFGDFKFSDKWHGGLNFFYVGERKDLLQSNTSLVTPSTVTLKGFFDANANVGYNVSERFTVFVNANNIASQKYQRWATYPVQQLQVLGGLTYKFDF